MLPFHGSFRLRLKIAPGSDHAYLGSLYRIEPIDFYTRFCIEQHFGLEKPKLVEIERAISLGLVLIVTTEEMKLVRVGGYWTIMTTLVRDMRRWT